MGEQAVDDFAERVRKAQEAASRKRQEELEAGERLRAEQEAAEAEITQVADRLARALRGRVPADVVVEHFESRVTMKRFGRTVREEATHHVLDGWLFGDTRHTFRDGDSRYDRTETRLEGFILAHDGGVHRCDVDDIAVPVNGPIVMTVRDPWGSGIHNGPMDAVMLSMYRDRILEAMVHLAVRHQIGGAL
jgi:hypothetical protein